MALRGASSITSKISTPVGEEMRMADQECAMILFMAILILRENYNAINNMVIPDYVKMNMSSSLFKGNFRRF